ncbi:YbdK family carboxylate-amine ligase [Variovorax sp. LT1R16]|uniref:YbdK family carboxylate-amine ligase n=1 Tax=Variovorax sp. LT1R16 TaxID=3443728 RepID=UPI003F47694A
MPNDSTPFDFAPSADLSVGVELELQIIELQTGDLAPVSRKILDSVGSMPPLLRGAIVPEVSAGMIEISTGVCADASEVLADLQALRERVSSAAAAHGAGVAGGGMHPFKRWSEQQIFDNSRYHALSALYGEVLKQTSVFGQHIHLGCADVDRAPLLMHQLARYVPHFVALSASSPFMEGHDTGFSSTRLQCPNPFPTGPCPPFTLSWEDLTDQIGKLLSHGIIDSIKDLHWDIRPKPAFGTVEIRVLDSPLSVERAASLACFAQLLGAWLLMEEPFIPGEDDYVVYPYNKFQAARFGLNAAYIDPFSGRRMRLSDHLAHLLTSLGRHAKTSTDAQHLDALQALVRSRQNDASVLRNWYQQLECMKKVALRSAITLTNERHVSGRPDRSHEPKHIEPRKASVELEPEAGAWRVDT